MAESRMNWQHFASQSDLYARFRPAYPDALYRYLRELAPGTHLAWDCATGTGQAALALAEHFDRVLATDASLEQLTQVTGTSRLLRALATAEAPPLADGSADLVTVAQAIHWFDFDKFYATVRRVLRPGGLLAAWTYHLPSIAPDIDRAFSDFYWQKLQPYFPPEMRYIEAGYHTLPFPEGEIEAPVFSTDTYWELADLVGFGATWSGTRRYVTDTGSDPLPELGDRLGKVWGEPETKRRVVWRLFLRVARLS